MPSLFDIAGLKQTELAKWLDKDRQDPQVYYSKTKICFVVGRLKSFIEQYLRKNFHKTSSSGKSVIGIPPDGVNGRAVLHFIPVQKWKT